ncbi:flagellar hook-filament junction protein FlgL [Kushneria pakistanensis]|uniref:Flagellar hook-filament junction protein FlgL n=1 Tax=Kushneria pakistanensis TaxID=1508770 RepID=A0ABQ3FRD6_9GAMM|nr:flagellar hook-associated protein FlgL [Kushneria pakistanensis]GHC33627.1 flagellar hook-filament junction protein FlgL [Kushneria pakistanensis]
MRISTSMMFERSQNAMQGRQSDLSKVGEQVANGKRIVSPSDDPRAASQALIVKQDQAVQEQYKSGRTSANSTLSLQENTLNSMSDLLVSAKGLIVKGGNGTYTDSDRASVATELEGLYNQMLGLANTRDSSGLYMFAGSKGDVKPFETAADGKVVTYAGDTQPLNVQVDASRSMNVNAAGSEVFKVPATRGGDAQSDLFKVFETAIETLRTPQTAENQDTLRASLDQANRQIDSGSDNILSVRSAIGSKLNELEVLGDIGDTRTISNKVMLSDLEDLDYAEAISRYTLGQIGLEASQKMFMQTQQTSLFSLIR